LYESKFSVNNAPRTLADALNQYDIERAKSKFGFEKDRKVKSDATTCNSSSSSGNHHGGNNHNLSPPIQMNNHSMKSTDGNTNPPPMLINTSSSRTMATQIGNKSNNNIVNQTTSISPTNGNNNIQQQQKPAQNKYPKIELSTGAQHGIKATKSYQLSKNINNNSIVQNQQHNMQSSKVSTPSSNNIHKGNNPTSTPKSIGLARFQQHTSTSNQSTNAANALNNQSDAYPQQRHIPQHQQQHPNCNTKLNNNYNNIITPHITNRNIQHQQQSKTQQPQLPINSSIIHQHGKVSPLSNISMNHSTVLERLNHDNSGGKGGGGQIVNQNIPTAKENLNCNGKRFGGTGTMSTSLDQQAVKKTMKFSGTNNPYTKKV
jgi:hypothetical protein